MTQTQKSTLGNLLNFSLAAAIIFATFGCGGFMKGFKKGYEQGRGGGTSNSSTPSSSDSSRNYNLKTLSGSFKGRSYDNAKDVTFFFESQWNDKGDQHGTATTAVNGVTAGKENFRVPDDKTLEFETQQGVRYRVSAEISPDGETLTMTTAAGITTTFQRY
jgi:hypothetical protein